LNHANERVRPVADPYRNFDNLFNYFTHNGSIFKDWLVETATTVVVGTPLVGEVGNFILWIGLHQLITMRAGIICNRDANGADAWVGLQALKRHGGGGELFQVGMTIDTGK
jgi:hypothetical protein